MAYGSNKKSGYGSQNSQSYSEGNNGQSYSSIPMFQGADSEFGMSSCKGTCYTDIGCTCSRSKR